MSARTKMRVVVVGAIALLSTLMLAPLGTVCCTTTSPPPGVPVFAGPASSSAVAACTNLATVGCAEAQDPSCAVTFDRRNLAGMIPVDVAAATSATTKTAARAAGVSCP